MDAVKFLEELERFMSSKEVHPYYVCDLYNAVKYIEKWSAEHPVKTRLMDFLEKFPKARLNCDGLPLLLPIVFGYCDRETCYNCEYRGEGEVCWDLSVKE